MPIPTPPTFVDKNIWVAAGDGDLSRVMVLIEHHSISPNVPDSFTYTPMHAAASYGHLDILTYLISKGGNVNLSDEDGDTPLYTVENMETARFLVDNGADIMWRNNQGLSPADSLEEEFPQVADYLKSLAALADSHDGEPENRESTDSRLLSQQRSQDAASERLTSSLMSQLSDLAQNEPIRDETHREEELRQVVSRAVLESLATGYTMTNGGTNKHSDQTDGQS